MKIGIKKMFMILFLLFLSIGVKGCSESASVGSPLTFINNDGIFNAFNLGIDIIVLVILFLLAYIFKKKLFHYVESSLFLFYLSIVLFVDFLVRGIPVLFFKFENWNVWLSPITYGYVLVGSGSQWPLFEYFPLAYFLSSLCSALILFIIHTLFFYIKNKLFKKT